MKTLILTGILCILIGIGFGFIISKSDTPNMTFHETIPIEIYNSKLPIFLSKQVPACNYELTLRVWREDDHTHYGEDSQSDIVIGIKSVDSNIKPISQASKTKVIPVRTLTNLVIKITDYEIIHNLPYEDLHLRLECPIFGGPNKFYYLIMFAGIIAGAGLLIAALGIFSWRRFTNRH